MIAFRLMFFVTICTADQWGLGAGFGLHFALVNARVHVACQRTAFPVICCRNSLSRLGSASYAGILIDRLLRGGLCGIRGLASVTLTTVRACTASYTLRAWLGDCPSDGCRLASTTLPLLQGSGCGFCDVFWSLRIRPDQRLFTVSVDWVEGFSLNTTDAKGSGVSKHIVLGS